MSNKSERVNQFIDIKIETANQLVKSFKPKSKIVEIHKLTGGKSTSNYKIKLSDSNKYFVLKIYPHNDGTSEKEYAVFKKVKNYLPVADIYYLNSEKKIINKAYSIIEYLQGVTLDVYIKENNRFPDKLAEEIGEKLALLHQNHYDKEGLLDNNLKLTNDLPPVTTWYEHFLEEYAGLRVGEKTKKQILNFLKENQDLLDLMTQYPVLTHGDFRPANLMVNNDRLVGILDWEFTLSAPRYFDIGQFLRVKEYLLGDTEDRFVNSYNKHAKQPLPAEWRILAKLMDLANLLCMLNSKEDRTHLHANMINLMDKNLNYILGS